MSRLVLRAAFAAALLICLVTPGSGSPPDDLFRVPLHIRVDRPLLEPVDASGLLIPRLEGYGFNTRPGEPMLPLRVLLAAIPEGCAPTIVIHRSLSEDLGPVPFAPVPEMVVSERRPDRRSVMEDDVNAPARGHVFRRNPEVWGRDAEFPAAPLRLGQVGRLRDQRVVEILVMPVVAHPRRGTLRLHHEISGEIVCAGGGGPLAGMDHPARTDPYFEGVYRDNLVNYEQGRSIRTRPGEADGAITAAGLSAAETAAMTDTAAPATTAPGTRRYKLPVSRDGVYQITHSELLTAAPDLVSVDPRTLLLEAEGVAVPIAVRNAAGASGEADGRFDPGDYVEFYGRAKGGPPTLLNHDFPDTFPDVYQANDFTDTQVYWLSATTGPGASPRIAERDGSPLAGLPLAADFEAEARWEENNIYLPMADADPFFSMPSLLAGSTQASRDLVLAIPGIAPVAFTASVTLRVRGGSGLAQDPDHRTRIWLNNDTTDAADVTWDGENIFTHEFTVPQSVLSDPTTIHVTAPGLSGITVDRQYLDSVTIRFRRTFAAAGDALVFSYPNQDARFRVTGLGAGTPTVFEVTATVAGSLEAQPVRITGATVSGAPASCTFEVTTDASAPPVRTFVVAAPAAILHPGGILPEAPPVLRDPTRAADMLVIASRDSVDTTPGGALDLLLAHRLNARGLTSAVVYVDQIYDEFGFGLRDPGAIRAFLAYAYSNWRGPGGTARAPSFVLLAGDASADYKDTLGLPDWVDQVPTLMLFNKNSFLGYYSSDHWLASFLGDDLLPDIHLGRITARAPAQSDDVFEKIRRYEQSPPVGPWKGRGVLITSDGKFVGEADDYEAVQASIAQRYFPSPPYSTPNPPLFYEEPPWNATETAMFTQDITDEWEAGAAAVSFLGHGNFTGWGLDRFFDTDTAGTLTNGDLLPVVLNVNCLSGGFHYLGPEGALGEVLVNHQSGGAVAMIAPSGLSSVFVAQVISDAFFEPLLGRTRHGEMGAVMSGVWSALAGFGSVIDTQSFTLLGDPATLFASPSPPPPTGLGASAGNARVDLDWSAPPSPVAGYRIYRAATSPAGPYAAVSCEPVDATSCTDRTVSNGTVYYYHAVSVDAEGFQGGASNLNDDCDAGPLCVRAAPLNPDPPAPPAGLAVVDQDTGSTLLVSWQSNPEPDIRRYSLYYGTAPFSYGARLDFGPTITSTILGGLTSGVRYYMVLTATNTSGLESDRSGEVSEVPHLVQGIAPPRAITDLQVTRSGADLVLRWTHPGTDIYSRPTTLAKFQIHRGAAPGFQPFASAPYAVLNDPGATTFTDVGAGGQTGDLYYLVTVVDAQGRVSGAGRELPGGIEDLALTLVGGSSLRLTWPAVTLDMQGLPTVLDHYQVHMTSSPVSRGSLGPSTIVPGMDMVRTLSVDLPTPAGSAFYSVLAVDARGNVSPF